ncbi:MAG TPA: DUF2934 domain-containing protein [Rhodocyclaceae bacterium]
MRATAKSRSISGKTAPTVVLDDEPFPDERERLDRIAQAAYYKAESRGFVPGQELDDWLEAEAELEERRDY